jgi:hypothetical protein
MKVGEHLININKITYLSYSTSSYTTNCIYMDNGDSILVDDDEFNELVEVLKFR